jgi:hypothetical protein
MAFIGCDFLQIGIKHATLGSFTLYPKAGENGQIEIGGIYTESDDKGITGSGEPIYKQTVKRWVVESPPIAWKRSGEDTLLAMQQLGASFEEIAFTFELSDGSTYIGTGKIVDVPKGASYDATIPIKMEGGGKLQKIEKQ